MGEGRQRARVRAARTAPGRVGAAAAAPVDAPDPSGAASLSPRGEVDGGRTLERLRLSEVSFAYDTPRGRLAALDGVSVDVPGGSVVAVIGPNGSGKSTLLRLAAGLLRPDAGRVEIDGQEVRGPDSRVGLVFQEPRLLPWRDLLGNVAFPLELAGRPPGERLGRARQLLDLVGLRAFARARPHELSGGMRQRVALARALALEPQLLLLDEPFSALDALTRERFNVELLGLWGRTGTTILLVTHSITEAVFLSDRVVVLSPRPGRVVEQVPVELPRPRRMADLDAAAVSSTAQRIRSHLSEPGDDIWAPATPRLLTGVSR